MKTYTGLKILIIAFFLWICSVPIYAQKTIGLDEAIKMATEQGYGSRLSQERETIALKRSSGNAGLPALNVTAEAGQVNSALFDSRVNISQGFFLPSYHKKYRSLTMEEYNMATGQTKLTHASVDKRLSLLYSEHAHLKAKKRLLENQQTLYDGVVQRSGDRVKAGYTDQLEFLEATGQRDHARTMLEETAMEISWIEAQVNHLLNVAEILVPDSDIRMFRTFIKDDKPQNPTAHPELILADAGIKMAVASSAWIKAQQQPQFTIGVSNMSIRGTGADDKVYGASSRFTSVQLGIAIPVFTGHLKVNQEVGRMNEQMAREMRDSVYSTLSLLAKNWYDRYTKNLDLLTRYEAETLGLAKLLEDAAEAKIKAGDIEFMNYALIISQALTIKLNHLDLLRKVNESAVEYHYCTLKN